MADFINLVNEISDAGLPIVLSALVIVFLYMMMFKIPKLAKNYFDSRKCNEDDIRQNQKNLQDQLFKQLEIITTVAQQGIEAQRRGNTAIEQNTIAFNTYQKVSEQMISSIIDLKDSTNATCDTVNQVHMEIIKIGERVK